MKNDTESTRKRIEELKEKVLSKLRIPEDLTDEKLIKQIEINTKENVEMIKLAKETIYHFVNFTCWVFGFFTGAFLILFYQLKELNEFTTLWHIKTSIILNILFILFVLFILAIISYRLIAFTILSRSDYEIIMYNMQKNILCDNLDMIPSQDLQNPKTRSTSLSGNLMSFLYLGNEMQEFVQKDTKTSILNKINYYTHWFIVIGFIVEYLLIFLILY